MISPAGFRPGPDFLSRGPYRKALPENLPALFLTLCFWALSALPAHAAWETAARAGYESNVDRAVDDGSGDMILAAHAEWVRMPSPGKRLGWTLAVLAEGVAYADYSDLSSLGAALEPGIVYRPGRSVTLLLSPVLSGTAVRDEDQSAVAFGGKTVVEERVSRSLFLGQYYAYTDSRAGEDVYSFAEHAIGIYAAVTAKKGRYGQAGYEFSRGDSFRTRSLSFAPPSPGPGGGSRSNAFSREVFKEEVDSHTASLRLGAGWPSGWFVEGEYSFLYVTGDSGSSEDHRFFAGLGYRN